MKRSPFYSVFKKPLVAGFITFTLLLFLTQYITYQKYLINENNHKKQIINQVDLIKEKLQSLIMFSYSATKSLAYIVERNGIPSDFDDIANELLKRSKYFDVVELVDSQGFITHVYPLKDNNVIGFNIITSHEASSGALATIKRNDFFIAGPVNLEQGGVGMVSRQPIIINNKFSGFSAVVTKLSTFFSDLNIDVSGDNQFVYQLSRVNQKTGQEDFFLDSDVSGYKEYAVPIEMEFGEWKLYVIPTKREFNTAIWFAILGLLLTMLGSLGVWYFAGRSERIHKLINVELKKQKEQLKLVYETSRKQIKLSESNLNKAQRIAKLGNWELDLETNKLTWSNQMFRIFKQNPEAFKVSHQAMLEAIHPEDREFVSKTYSDSIINKVPYSITYRLKLDNNQIKYIDEQCETIFDENQVAEKSFGIIQDVTFRIKREEVLKKSELLYRSLTANAPVAIFNINQEGECTYVNEHWIKLSGMSYTAAMGQGWLDAFHPEDKVRLITEWKSAMSSNPKFKTELRFKGDSGKITFLSVKATKLLDANNNVFGYIGIASDITERISNEKELLKYKNNLEELVNVRTEELNDSKEALLNLLEDLNFQSIELEKEKVKAQSADLMKSAFLATMSHELRTPMNSIIGFTGILLKELAGPLNEEQKKQIKMVKNSGEHLLGLINDILDISKIEAGKLKVAYSSFDYLASLEKTINFLQPQASAKGINLLPQISSLDVVLVSDEVRVEQVLLNLMSNAIKFSKKGTITIKVDIKDNMLVTQVIDQGIGINKNDINKLFMPFTQLEEGLDRNHEGTGLGLSISKNLIEKLGGQITVVSTFGEGSNFTFTLPLIPPNNK